MAKNSVRDYSATNADNTDIQSIDISEGCSPAGINNALREVMVDLKNVSTGAVALETPSADQLNVDNLRLDGNTISSTDTNGNITLDPDGTGVVNITGNVSVDGGTIKLDGNYPVGTGNVALGDAALDSVASDGTNNVAIGADALTANTTGDGGTAVGYQALYSNTTALRNTGIGQYALYANTTGAENTSVGSNSLQANTTGSYNTAIGRSSLAANTTASYNTAVGFAAGYAVTTAQQNNALGYEALRYTTTGSYNNAFGVQALRFNTTGGSNTAMGQEALYSNTTASNNTAVGYQSLYANTTGANNTAMGHSSGSANTTGFNNAMFGVNALSANTTGAQNVAVGRDALKLNTTASGNTAVGYQAGYSSAGSGTTANCFIGPYAGYSNTTGKGNTYIGGYNSSTTAAAGYYMTTGSSNTIIGGYNGNQGGLDIRTSSNNIVLSDGDGNPRLHIDSSGSVLLGTTNDIIWNNNASEEGIVLYQGKAFQVARNNDICLLLNRQGSDGSIQVFAKGGTQVGRIDVTASSTSYVTSSDYRLKENVADLTGAADRVQQLAPKRFNFIVDADTTVDGFLAHEVQSVVPEAITGTHNEVDADGNPVYQGIDQAKLVPLLTAALQEALTKIDALETRIVALETN